MSAMCETCEFWGGKKPGITRAPCTAKDGTCEFTTARAAMEALEGEG